MSIQTYSAERINMLKQTLLNSVEAGKPQDYEIRVDDMRVVPRTNDVDQFENYEDFVTEETKKVAVLVYDGSSRRNQKHIFLRRDEKKEKSIEKGLSGIEVEKIISDKLEQEKRQWKYEQIEKENKELKKKLEEADEHFSKTAEYIEELKDKRKLEDLHWGELIGIAGESILRRNTHLIAKVPGMQGLAGIIEKDTKEQEKQIASPSPEPEMQASFSKVKAEEETNNDENKSEQPSFSRINEDDKQRLDFLRQLQERFSEEELKQVLTLLNMLVEKPKAIEPAIVYIVQCNEKIKAKTEAEAKKQEADETKHEQNVNAVESLNQQDKASEEKENYELPTTM